jgi:hypothetical protein
MASSFKITTLAAAIFAAASAVSAQESPPPASPTLVLELNGAQPSDKGCRLTFVVTNHLGGELSKAAFEIALFNEAGVVDKLTVLDFNELSAGKTKVARFDLAGADCSKLSRVLINTATECAGTGIEPKACLAQLQPVTRSGIAFGI